jgi:hypothetical protein
MRIIRISTNNSGTEKMFEHYILLRPKIQILDVKSFYERIDAGDDFVITSIGKRTHFFRSYFELAVSTQNYSLVHRFYARNASQINNYHIH